MRWPPGSEPTRSARSRAGTVVDPSVLDLAGDPVHEPDLEVRRGEAEAAVLGLEEDVGEHGQRASVGDRSTHDPEAARQVLLHDRELHVRSTPWAGSIQDFTYEGCVAQGFPAPAKPRHSVCVSSFILLGPSSPSSWCGVGGSPCSLPIDGPVDEPPGFVGRCHRTGDAAPAWRWRTRVAGVGRSRGPPDVHPAAAGCPTLHPRCRAGLDLAEAPVVHRPDCDRWTTLAPGWAARGSELPDAGVASTGQIVKPLDPGTSPLVPA